MLDLVTEAAALVIARARVALGVFVGQHAAGRFAHGGRNVVFAGDQFQRRLLTLGFLLDQVEDGGVGLFKIH